MRFMRAIAGVGLSYGLALLLADGQSVLEQSQSKISQVVIRYDTKESAVSLHEPIVVLFSVHNGLSKPVTLTLGAQDRQYFSFSLATPDGQILHSFRNPGAEVDVVTIGPGQTIVGPGLDYHQELLINQWFPFETTGKYLLTSQLTNPIDVAGESPLAPQRQTTTILIKSRDPARLKTVCAELVDQVRTAPNAEAAQEPALKLSYIHDPIAVPYLAEALEEVKLINHLVIPALEKIGTDDAVEVLLSALHSGFADREDLSRQALTQMEDRISNPGLKETVRRALAAKSGT